MTVSRKSLETKGSRNEAARKEIFGLAKLTKPPGGARMRGALEELGKARDRTASGRPPRAGRHCGGAARRCAPGLREPARARRARARWCLARHRPLLPRSGQTAKRRRARAPPAPQRKLPRFDHASAGE